MTLPAGVRGAILILATAAVIFMLRYAQDVIVPFVLSALCFYALDPAVDWLHRRRLPRVLAVAVVMTCMVSGAGIVAYKLRDQAVTVVTQLPDATRKFARSVSQRGGRREAPGAITQVQDAARELEKAAADVTTPTAAPNGVTRVQVEEPPFRATDYLWWGSVGLFTIVSQVIMILFLTFFMLLADDLFKRKLVRQAGDTLEHKRITVRILGDIASQIQRFVIVQVFTSAVVAVVTGLALWSVGLNQAAVWGFAAGLFNSAPYFGPVIVTVGLTVVAFMQFGTFAMAFTVAGIALIITTLEGWLITPTLLGRAAQMNQIAVFVGLLFFSWLWGVWGMLLAVPMLIVVKAVCDHVDDFKPVADFSQSDLDTVGYRVMVCSKQLDPFPSLSVNGFCFGLSMTTDERAQLVEDIKRSDILRRGVVERAEGDPKFDILAAWETVEELDMSINQRIVEARAKK